MNPADPESDEKRAQASFKDNSGSCMEVICDCPSNCPRTIWLIWALKLFMFIATGPAEKPNWKSSVRNMQSKMKELGSRMQLYFNGIFISYWTWNSLRNLSSQQVRNCWWLSNCCISHDRFKEERHNYLKLATVLNCCFFEAAKLMFSDGWSGRRGNEFLHLSFWWYGYNTELEDKSWVRWGFVFLLFCL